MPHFYNFQNYFSCYKKQPLYVKCLDDYTHFYFCASAHKVDTKFHYPYFIKIKPFRIFMGESLISLDTFM